MYAFPITSKGRAMAANVPNWLPGVMIATHFLVFFLGMALCDEDARRWFLRLLSLGFAIALCIGFIVMIVKADMRDKRIARQKCELSGGKVVEIPESAQFTCVRDFKKCTDTNASARCVIPWEPQ